MKHIEKLVFNGDEEVYGIMAGFCNDIESFVVRNQSGWIYDYSNYYAINEQEYAEVIKNKDRLNNGELLLDQVVPGYHDRFVGADYIRGYDIIPNRTEATFKPYMRKDGPFFCGDGIFYYHLCWQGHNYAAVPRLWNGSVEENGQTIRTGPYRDRPDISLIKVLFNDIEIPLCYGKEVNDF